MKTKHVDVGAPAYMAQYAGLMVLLLAFFIVLVSLSRVQQGGFKSGIGEIKNALGIAGGYGFFNFAFVGRKGGYAPTPNETDTGETEGIDSLLHQGEGGVGDTDIDAKDVDKPGFVRFALAGEFPKGSDKPTPQILDELRKIGLGLALFDKKVEIRCFSSERGDPSQDRLLAISRASLIARCLIDSGVPAQKISCYGYPDDRYFESSSPAAQASNAAPETAKKKPAQGAYFYLFVKNFSKLDSKEGASAP